MKLTTNTHYANKEKGRRKMVEIGSCVEILYLRRDMSASIYLEGDPTKEE